MKIIKLVLLLIFLHSCTFLKENPPLKKIENDGYKITIGCDIYDLYGKLLVTFPGDQCVFFEDGSHVSYNPVLQELSKYDSFLKKKWTVKLHVHHGITVTQENNLLIKTSGFYPYNGKKNVRFDELILLNQEGKTLGRFSFYETIKELNNVKKSQIVKTDWDRNISFEYEATHLPSVYEVLYPMKKEDRLFAAKGSFLVSLNTSFSGIYVLSSDLSEIQKFTYVLTKHTFHDLQQYSETEVVYFLNNFQSNPQNDGEKAKVVVQDIYKKIYTHEFDLNLYASYGGGVQVLSPDLFMISDVNSQFGDLNLGINNSTDESLKIKLHNKRKGRIIFYSPKKGIVHELHFQKPFSNAKLNNLRGFLSKVIKL